MRHYIFEKKAMEPFKILIVEDAPLAMLFAKRILATLGHQADLATSAEIALVLHYQNQYDLILSDIHLPMMSGFAMVTLIRSCERKYGLPNANIVLMTSRDLEEFKTQTVSVGGDGLLKKPLECQPVMALIESCKAQSL
jgi:CheY-like chemotaxis protein